MLFRSQGARRDRTCHLTLSSYISTQFGPVLWCLTVAFTALQEGVKYAVRLRNYGSRTANGDGGISTVLCSDGVSITFSTCSLSSNGTNQTRGQIPQILYYRYTHTPEHSNTHTNTLSSPLKPVGTHSLFNTQMQKGGGSLYLCPSILLTDCVSLGVSTMGISSPNCSARLTRKTRTAAAPRQWSVPSSGQPRTSCTAPSLWTVTTTTQTVCLCVWICFAVLVGTRSQLKKRGKHFFQVFPTSIFLVFI